MLRKLPKGDIRKFAMVDRAGYHPVIDQSIFREPIGDPFYYDIYQWVEGVSGAVAGDVWRTFVRLGGLCAIKQQTYMTSNGFEFPVAECSLILNTIPPGMYFHEIAFTQPVIDDAKKHSNGWWWPAWLAKSGPMGLVFVEETDMMVVAGLNAGP